jgi:hypothetical protein
MHGESNIKFYIYVSMWIQILIVDGGTTESYGKARVTFFYSKQPQGFGIVKVTETL